MIGTMLGRYEILESIGRGGMGEVFLAHDPALDRQLAIKVLTPEFVADKDGRTRLLREARAASALNHPNIHTVHDLGEADGVDRRVAQWQVEFPWPLKEGEAR